MNRTPFYPNHSFNRAFLLCSPAYLGMLGLLLLNDFFLKQHYPGAITGKLSDFAGLFVFAVFLLIVHRARWILFALAFAFAIWKSPFSQPLIDGWNTIVGISIGRTIDLTDLMALSVLPLAWFYYAAAKPISVKRQGCMVSCLISIFAFAATSPPPRTPEQEAAYHAAFAEFSFFEADAPPKYSFPFPRSELQNRAEQLGMSTVVPEPGYHGGYFISKSRRDFLKDKSHNYPPELSSAMFDVEETSGGVTIVLKSISIARGNQPSTRTLAIRLFEQRVIKPLHGRS